MLTCPSRPSSNVARACSGTISSTILFLFLFFRIFAKHNSSASAHPLGGVVAAFAKLLNRNYRPAEDCYKFFDDAIDDTHSFIGKALLPSPCCVAYRWRRGHAWLTPTLAFGW